MKKFDFFVTGKFDAAEIREMREKADKPRVLFEIGQQLRTRRQALKLERSAAAARCGLGADRLARFEHGAADVGFETLEKYCFVLGVDVNALLLPLIGGDADAARVLLDLARTWTSEGKPLTIADVIGIAGAVR